MNNKERFLAEYTRILSEQVTLFPARYAFGLDRVPSFSKEMVDGLACGLGSNTGYACKATCKLLGIKPTYKAIEAYLKAVEG